MAEAPPAPQDLQALLQQLTQQLMNQQQLLQQQAQQIAALQAQPVPVPPVDPLAFALTPAMAQDGIINYKDSAGIKLHKAIVAPLATLYDGTPSKLMAFLDSVKQRATDSGWNRDLLNVSNQDPVTPVQLNLIVSHQCHYLHWAANTPSTRL